MAKTKTRKASTAPAQGRMGCLGTDGAGHSLDRDGHGRLRLSCPREDSGFAMLLNPQEREPKYRCACGMRWMPLERDDGSGAFRLRVSL